jgi:predicted Zn-dependent peptidase
MEGVNSIATSVMVNVGSRFETPAINGVSHFLEHMVFKGTKKYPTTDAVMFIERMGGLQNAYTDIDITNYHNKTLSADWKEALEINKELTLYPRLEEQYVDKERDVILEEMKRYEDEPSMKVGEIFHGLMYPETKLGMQVIGTAKALKAADAGTLRSYHDAWYTPDRTVIVVAGKIDAQQADAITKQTEEWFGNTASKKTDATENVSDIQKTPNVVVLTKKDAQQAHITLGVRTFGRNNSDRFSWNVFNLLFGVSFTSRLFKEIREKRGLCYTVRSASDGWDDVGYWSIYAGVATEKVEETVKAITEELTKVVQSGVTDEEVVVAKKRLLTMLAFRSEDPEFMNEYYGRQELYHQPILTLDDYFAHITAVSKESINALVRKYILTQTMNLAVVWNKPDDEKLVQLLKI